MATVGFVALNLLFHREDRVWVGLCRELGTSTYSRSLERAKNELLDMVVLHLNALEEEGERERFFAEHDIPLYPDKPTNVEVPVDPVEDGEGGDTFILSKTFPIPAHLLSKSRPPTELAKTGR